jgi:hypothetical protein
VSYALGRGGHTRRKVALASGCVLEYVSNMVFMAGTGEERDRCRSYLDWLLAQRNGRKIKLTDKDLKDRDDCVQIIIPRECKSYILGNRSAELRRIEEETQTFLFMADDEKGEERVLAFSHVPSARAAAERMMNAAIRQAYRQNSYGNYGGGRDNNDYDRGYRSRDDDRYGDSGRSSHSRTSLETNLCLPRVCDIIKTFIRRNISCHTDKNRYYT